MKKEINFDPLQHLLQQPMIEKVTEYFSGNGVNPCSGDDGYTVMWMIDQATGNKFTTHISHKEVKTRKETQITAGFRIPR